MCKSVFGFGVESFIELGRVFDSVADVVEGHTVIGELDGMVATMPTLIQTKGAEAVAGYCAPMYCESYGAYVARIDLEIAGRMEACPV